MSARRRSRRVAPDAGYLRVSEVADLFHVAPRTVATWAEAGKLPHVRTLGGHRRYPAAMIRQLAAAAARAAAGPDQQAPR